MLLLDCVLFIHVLSWCKLYVILLLRMSLYVLCIISIIESSYYSCHCYALCTVPAKTRDVHFRQKMQSVIAHKL